MAVYKRGGIYWYKFCFKGECIRESARTSNKEAARQIEAAHRLKLAKGEAGIKEQKTAPMFSDFAPRFEAHIATERAEKPETIRFYRSKLRRLLEDPVISGLRLDAIDNAVIDDYKTRRRRQASRYGRPVSPASVNRELATLRRLLRVANKWKELKDVPEIELLDGERIRD